MGGEYYSPLTKSRTGMSISNQLKKASFRKAFSYLEKNPEENALKLMSWVDKKSFWTPTILSKNRSE